MSSSHVRRQHPRRGSLELHRHETAGRILSHCLDAGHPSSVWHRHVAIGPFVVDFYCPAAQLIVELDHGRLDPVFAAMAKGATHHRRDIWLRAHDLRVLRFRNEDITRRLEMVLAIIHREVFRAVRASPPDTAN